jgi:precorrin-6B C5,15-methyltransferase / cobalt-precorrin-6B C5,C15-methyltransferase
MTTASANCAAKRWLSIVGIGEDGIDGLSPVARKLIGTATLVVGGERHLALAAPLIAGECLIWPSPMGPAFDAIARRRGAAVAVLASGDPFHFGVGKQLAGRFPVDEMLCLPHPSAFSLAAARLGWALQDVALVSLHGRPLEGIIRHLCNGARILALVTDGTTPAKLASLLIARGMQRSRLTVLEAMGGLSERVRTAPAHAFALSDVGPLTTVAVEVVADRAASVVALASGLDDALFEHDGQITKREIRAVTLSALAPCPGELLWDVGLGAGSVAIEWLLRHSSLRAIGVEARPDRAARAARNAAALGAMRLDIKQGWAPDAFDGLEPPDAAFIGGGISDVGVFERVWATLRSGGRVVANAVSLEGEARLSALYRLHGGALTRISVARAEPVGGKRGWRSAMPVTQWRVAKP